MVSCASVSVARTARRLGVLALAGLLLAACGGTAQNGGSGKPLVIGVSVSLNGDFSGDGKALERGYQLWADDVNAKGGLLGRHVTFKFVDDASSTQQVVTNYQNLITKDKVDLTFGPFSSLLTIPASTIVARYGYAFPEPAGGGPEVFSRGLKNIFFVQPAPVVNNLVSYANWLLSLPEGKRPASVAYATEDDPFTQPQIDTVRARLTNAGIRSAYYKVYPAETTDYTPIALAVAQSGAQAVILGTQLPDAIAFVQTFEQQRFQPTTLIETAGPDQGAQFSDKIGSASTEGIMVPAGWWPSAKTDQNAHFVKAYLQKYGGAAGDISGDAAEAYSVGQVVEQAANRVNSIDNTKLVDALHKGSFDTIQGTLSFDAKGQPKASTFLVQWQKGQTVPVYPSAAAVAQPEYPKPNWAS